MTQDQHFEQLKHPNPHMRERAMWEIAENRDDTTIPRLMANLAEDDVVYRRASVKALGVIGTDAVPFLVDVAANSDDVTARASAIKAMTQVVVRHPDTPFPQEGMEALKRLMNDANPVVYVASVMTLGEIGPASFDILADALQTTDNVALAVAIVNAMPALGDERARATLQQVLSDDTTDGYVKDVAESALSRLDLVLNNQPQVAQ